MATQNPIESEGTYPLPEAQVDRFMLKVLIGYPEHDEELTIVQRQLVAAPELRQALSLDELKALQRAVLEVYVDPALISYAVDVATATRDAARARARRHGRLRRLRRQPARPDQPRSRRRARSRCSAAATTCSSRTCSALAKDALRHRLVLTYQALAEEVTPDTILDAVLAAVPVPQLDLVEADRRRMSTCAPPAAPRADAGAARARARCRTALLRALDVTHRPPHRRPARRRLPLDACSATAPSSRRSGRTCPATTSAGSTGT